MLVRSLRSLFAPLVALALLTAAPTAYAADDDDPEVVAQAKEHYKAGLEAYKAGKYDVAIRELKKAYLLKRLPPLLLNIGATDRKMGDLDLSLHFYQKFLDEAPADAKDRPEVEKIIGEIKKDKAGGGADSVPRSDDAPPPPSSKEGRSGGGDWVHNVIDAVPPDMPIDVRVQTAVMKGVKVFVYYRGPGQADFNSVLMKRRGREKVGRIPAAAVTGRSLQYYLEAKDSAGTVVKSSGSQSNPNIIMIEDGVKPVMLASMSRRGDDEPEEQPEDEDRPKKRKPSRDLDEESAPTTGHVDLTDDEPVRTPPRKQAGKGLTPLTVGGIVAMSLGVVFVAGGGAMLGIAKNTADTLTGDSHAPVDSNNNPIFFNNDPNAGSTQESGLQSRGKALNGAGIAAVALGSAGVVAGAACLIADAVMKSEAAHPHKKKAKKRRRRVVDEDDEEEEQSFNRKWYVAPSAGPGMVGAGGGFTF